MTITNNTIILDRGKNYKSYERKRGKNVTEANNTKNDSDIYISAYNRVLVLEGRRKEEKRQKRVCDSDGTKYQHQYPQVQLVVAYVYIPNRHYKTKLNL